MSESRGSHDEDEGQNGESHKERIDRELIELLNEIRVALPGVQFLFAFLLIVPFQQTAAKMSDFQRDIYFVALVSAAVATALLIAPAAQHRVLFRQKEKVWLDRDSYLADTPGFVEFKLLKGPQTEEYTLYSSHSLWQSRDAFEASLAG